MRKKIEKTRERDKENEKQRERQTETERERRMRGQIKFYFNEFPWYSGGWQV